MIFPHPPHLLRSSNMPLPLSMDDQSRGEGRFDTVALDQSGVAGVGEVSSLLEPRYWIP